MLHWILGGIIGILIICLIVISNRKIQEEHDLKLQVERLRYQKDDLVKDIGEQRKLIEEYTDKIVELQNKYRQELNKKTEDLNLYFENQKTLRQSELDSDFERQKRERQETLDLNMRQMTRQAQEQVNKAEIEAKNEIERWKKAEQDIAAVVTLQEERYEALLAPLQQYEKEQQERLFYTIQVPDEYKEDINFLVTTVSQKVQHPDVINKLVWAEYVKPYIDETFKRVNIEDKPGIYKITNIKNGKSYIGKSTNVKKRLTDHFKSSIGIKTIADQAVHHEIWKTGFWNWTIEVIIYCDKEQLNELEKYYINFFKTNTYGYNKTGGGEG